ncbi:unnamed protein product [marine sediment metagenome]|uniref:HTH cro/C1-type domain-containing protein n=1 Tax=marine sediment metagenome TaxID=412755 RepID=X1NFI3_9ZZZZ
MNNNLGKRLKERREARELTLKQLSGMTGVHTSHLGRIERDERFPSAYVLRRLAKPLGFGEVELFKLAGFLLPDETDDRIAKFKAAMKVEAVATFTTLIEKIDNL